MDNQRYAQLQTFYLAGAGVSIGNTSVLLTNFRDIDGTPLTMAAFGDIGYGTVQPNTQIKEEQISFTGITQNINGTALLTGVKNVSFLYPYDQTTGFLKSHSGGTKFIISNTAGYYDTFANKRDTETIEQPWTFNAQTDGANPKIDDPAYIPNNDDYVVKRYVDSAIASGLNTDVEVTDTNSATSGNTQVNSLSFPITPSGVNRGALIQIITQQDVTIGTVTVGASNATQIVTRTDTPNNIRQEQWFVTSPNLGTQNVVITIAAAGTAYITAGAEAIKNVNQVSPTGATQTAVGDSTAPTLTLVTTADNSKVFDGLATTVALQTFTPGTGQTNNWNSTTGTYQGASSVESAGSSPDSVNMDYTLGVSTDWVYTAVEIKPVPSTAVSDHKVNVTGADTTPNYLNDKMTAGSGIQLIVDNPGADERLRIVNTGSAGNSSLLSSNQYLGLGTLEAATGSSPDGYVLTDTTSSRIMFPYTDQGTSGNSGKFRLRIFKNDFGSFYQENDIAITSAMLSQSGSGSSLWQVVWCNDGTYIYAIVRYRRDVTTSFTAADVIRFNIDGTGNVTTNIYVQTGTNLDRLLWDDGNSGASVVGSSLFLLWRTSGGVDQFREYAISGTSYTLANTYIRSGTVGAKATRTVTYDTVATTFYLSGGGAPFQKWTISGSNFLAGTTAVFDELGYSNNSMDATPYFIARIEGFQTTSFTVYSVNEVVNTDGVNKKTFHQLQGVTFPKI